MRFMMLMIPRVYQGAKGKNVGPDFAPNAKEVELMMKYNEELAKAGALIALDGLHPIGMGARISFSGGKSTVTDGRFTESTEVLGGYWVIQVNSKEEAIQWARRCPAQDGDAIEIRQVFEVSEFPPDVQEAAESSLVATEIGKHKNP